MEFLIKVATTDLKLSVSNNDYSERELKLIEILMLNVAAPANAQITGENLAFNPLDKDENDIFHFQFAWQKSLEEKLYNEFEETFNRRIGIAFKMSNINDVTTTFKINSFQTS